MYIPLDDDNLGLDMQGILRRNSLEMGLELDMLADRAVLSIVTSEALG